MHTAQERVDTYFEEQRPVGVILEPEQSMGLLLAAVRKYMAYGVLERHAQQHEEYEEARRLDPSTPEPVLDPINPSFQIGSSEWGVIEPLWHLYMERERALMVEATRMMGDVSHGRMSSEVQQDITLYESDMHLKAFCYPIVTV